MSRLPVAWLTFTAVAFAAAFVYLFVVKEVTPPLDSTSTLDSAANKAQVQT